MNQESREGSVNYSQVDKELQKLQKSTKRWQWGLIFLTLINLIALAWVFDLVELALNSKLVSEKIPIISAPSDNIKTKPEESGGMPFKNKDSPIWSESNTKADDSNNKENLMDPNIETEDSKGLLTSKEPLNDKSAKDDSQNIPSEILSVLNANRTITLTQELDSQDNSGELINLDNQIDDNKGESNQIIEDNQVESNQIIEDNQVESNQIIEDNQLENNAIQNASDINIDQVESIIDKSNEVGSEKISEDIKSSNNESDRDNNIVLSDDEVLVESLNTSDTVKKDTSLVIQLASLKSQKLAEIEWTRLKKIYPELMNKLEPIITEVTIKDKGTFYRLQSAIPSNINNPKVLCDLFKQAGQSCIVINTLL